MDFHQDRVTEVGGSAGLPETGGALTETRLIVGKVGNLGLLPAQAWLTARMGMVTPEVASEDASMWQRPSKIPPGSMTMQGE